MRFDSLVFAAFLLVFLPLYWSLSSRRAQNLLILVGSYVFYGWWDWRFLFLIAGSTVLDYFASLSIGRRQEQGRPTRALVVLSIVANLGTLGVFKYYDFFANSLAEALAGLGIGASPALLNVALPVGISFYTFQTMSYTIDVYRGRQAAHENVIDFACYVAFFPQLVAGPIERAGNLLPQFAGARSLTAQGWRSGLTLIVFGLTKKVAIADNVAPLADFVFSPTASDASGPLVLAGSLAFALQIYADFSGYSDIARGTARLLGFELCVNFDKPYVSATPSEFWRRWHISLSQWLRDYLYISLGGNRSNRAQMYRNLMLTMVLGGLWHGAAWHFVLWGFFHGALLCLYRLCNVDKHLKQASSRLLRYAAIGVFFAFTLYGWMLFRAQDLSQVTNFTVALFSAWGSGWSRAISIIAMVGYFSVPVVVHHVLSRGRGGEKWLPANAYLWLAVLALVSLYGVTHARASEQAFIYFQF